MSKNNLYYRASTGFIPDNGATVGDIVRYEQENLGNDLRIPRELYEYLDQHSYRVCLWVGATREVAERYGEEISPIDGTDCIVLAIDGEGGKLLFRPWREFSDHIR